MVYLYVNDKKFGKNYIDYKIKNTTTGEEETGKCGNHGFIGNLFFKLREEHGDEMVRMLVR